MDGSGDGRHRPVALVALVALAIAVTGCGSSLFATTTDTASSTSSTSTTPTSAAVNGVAVGIPVAGCTFTPVQTAGNGFGQSAGTGAGGGSGSGSGSGGTQDNQTPTTQGSGGNGSGAGGWRPSFVLAPIPTALVSQVEFYSDGVHTVLAPTGWTCSLLDPSQQEVELVVYPASDPNPPTNAVPAAGSEGVFALFDTTNQPQGVSIVCPFFTVPVWQEKEALCFSGHTPNGEQTTMPTPDVASVTDPAGVVGSLPGSGGPQAVSGVVIFPQVLPAVQLGQGIDVAEESCSLTSPALCPTILSDFEVREFPVPPAAQSAAGH
jgi:hypothetical protein